MKIAQVSPYDYPFPGGVTEHISYLDRHLREMGHEVQIIAPSSTPEEELDSHVVRVGNVIVPVPFSGSVARISLSPRIYLRVKRLLQREQFDVIHIHEPMTPALPMAVLRHSKAVNVGTFHAYRSTHAAYEYGRPMFRYFVRRLHGCIAVSIPARESVARYFPGEYRIIPNGIETRRFGNEDIRPIERFDDGMLNVLFVGRLEKRKGFKYLLRAFARVKERVPESRLIVVGAYEHEDKAPFVRYARYHHIRHVKFVGYVHAEELPRYYHTAHVFCAPSTGFESFGIVLLEAMASGIPVVASDIPGYNAVLEHGREGLLAPAAEPVALAEAIVALLRDPQQRRYMGEQGRRKAARYDWSIITRRVYDFYLELLERRRMTAILKDVRTC
ncbi:MAG: glycosyltransferase family 4 protein [Chloroflexi bacterium]|nr:glycosyltransferase family 4 protein [Chloroflexota bacterium]